MVARNCHKAVYHGLYLRDIEPVYIYPHMQYELGINGGITPSRVERTLEENKDVEGILITSPTYDGVVSDVKAIAEIAHRYGIPLIVDEAHGAHFRFSEYFPASAGELGADVVIQSLHKTLPSMTQTALLHRYSDRVDREKLSRFMGIYQSSSPSYILMGSMNACLDRIAREGKAMFAAFTDRLENTRRALSECKQISLASEAMVGTAGIYDYDRSKLILSTRNTSMTGREFHRILRERYHLEMEMEAEAYVLAMATVGDTEEGLKRLVRAVKEIDGELEEKRGEQQKPRFFQENSP
ncbi:lysine decarboxylase, partial [gut metagenome]